MKFHKESLCGPPTRMKKFLLIMKLTFILLTAAFLQVSASSLAQRITIRQDNAKLVNIFKEIRKQTGYDFFYNDRLIDQAKVVNLNLVNMPLEEALKLCFANQPFVYSIKNKIVIVEENKKTLLDKITAYLASIDVKGKVTDENGLPLPGVNIAVKGTKVAASTDLNGEFILKNIDEKAVLVITMIGRETIELKAVPNLGPITLKMSAGNLDQVVITGYQTVSKDKMTGTYQTLSGDVLKQRPTQNFLDKLDGMAAGLSITRNENGDVAKVEIRGRNTLYAAQEPLYVVDGFPISSSINSINPEDIESITVLSDAAATAQWGVKASNGVIVVTTKKAKQGQTNVEFSTFAASTEKIDFSKNRWLTPAQEVDADQEYIDKGWRGDLTGLPSYYNLNQVEIANMYRRGVAPGAPWSESTFNSFISQLKQNDAAKQWEDYIFRNATNIMSSLSVSAGTERNNLYASLLFNNDEYKEVRNNQQKIVLNIRDQFKIRDNLSLFASINASTRHQELNGSSASTVGSTNAYDNLVNANGRPIQYYNFMNPFFARQKEAIPGYFSWTSSELDELNARDKSAKYVDVRAQFGVDYEVIKGLKLTSQYQYERNFGNSDSFNSMDLPSQRLLINNYYNEASKTYQVPIGTIYSFSRTEIKAFNWRNTLSFDRQFNKHGVSIFTGFDMRKIFTETVQDRAYGYNKQTTNNVPVNSRDVYTGLDGIPYKMNSDFGLNNTDIREIGFFVMPGYTYNDKYTINANYRVDQKNLFGSDPRFRYKPLWSVGTSWQIGKESFLENQKWINRLVLKGSYGITGNASDRFQPYTIAGSGTVIQGAKTWDILNISPTSPGNSGLKWEETSTLNFGLEFAVLNNRLNGTLSVYHENSTDLLGQRLLDPTNGFTSGVINYASVKNKGIELSLQTSVIKDRDFRWDISTNISYNRNKVTEVQDPSNDPYMITTQGSLEKGLPIENLWSYNYAGLNANGIPMWLNAAGASFAYNDQNNTIAKDDLLYFGSSVAPVYGGLSTTFAYKGFDLSMNLSFKFGHYFMYDVSYGYPMNSNRINAVYANRWQKPGDEAITRVPRLSYNGINPQTGLSENMFDTVDTGVLYSGSQDFVMKADYIKFRDIILGYNFSKNTIKKTPLSTLRLSVQVTNPFQWYKNQYNVDPDAPNSGALTNLKVFTLGLRAGF